MKNSKLLEESIKGEIDPSYAFRARRFLEAMEKHRPRRVLDAGCGRGFAVRAALEYEFVEKAAGIDGNPEHVAIARATVGDDARADIHEGRLEKLPFPDGHFDLVVCFEVIEHVSDEKPVLRELRRVLRPGGVILLSVPNREFPLLWDPLNWVLMRTAGTHVNKDIHWLAGIWADHERLYTEKEFVDLAGQFFTIQRHESVIRWCWPFSHFLLYGIGKNLVLRCGWKMGNRFDFGRKSALSKLLASTFRLPTLLDGKLPSSASLQIVVEASNGLRAIAPGGET